MVILTGASRGLGKAIGNRLSSQGHQVVGLSKSGSSDAFPVLKCDVSDYASLKQASRQIRESDTPVRALINAAGIASMNLAVTTNSRAVQNIIATNLMGTIYCCQIFGPLMMREKFGRIINFSTIAVPMALKGESVYAASKAGIESFSRVFAREVSDFGLTVNCIAPGPIKTDLISGISDRQINDVVRNQVIPRIFGKEDICDLVDLLLDQKAKSLSGQVFHVGGI